MKKLLLWAFTASLAVTGCRHPKPETTTAVRIVPAIQSRVTGLHFDTGDRIGLTIVRESGASYVTNRLLTYDGATFSAQDLIWYNNLYEKSTLTAYYPYSAAGAPDRFDIAVDQTAGCETSDLLAAVKRDVTPGAAPVGMTFRHLMSQLSIVVTNASDASVDEITVGGFVPTAQVDFEALAAVPDPTGAAADVRAFEVTADAAYRVVLVPQQGTLTVTVATADGKSRSKTIAAAHLMGGRRYDLSVVVTNIDIALSLSGEILDWDEGGSLEGEDGGNGDKGDDNGGDVTGDDPGVLTYGGDTYRTVALGDRVWMAENLRYRPEGVAVGDGMWYPANGETAAATQGMLYDYATATRGTATRSDAPLQGICPSGWHIPDADELAALAASPECGSDFFSCAGFWIVNGINDRYGAENRGYLMSATPSDSGKCSYLSIAEGSSPQLVSLSQQYGVSLRCVRDVR